MSRVQIATTTQQAARLLIDAADYFEATSENVPERDEELRKLLKKNIEVFKNLSQLLGEPAETIADPDYEPAFSKIRKAGPWHRRSKFLGDTPDRPLWIQGDRENRSDLWEKIDKTSVEWQVLATAFEEISRDLDETRDRVHIAKPAFLQGVTLAHLERTGQIKWDAFFSIVEEEEKTETGQKQKKLKARSFDYKSLEVHRLNAVSPLNTVGYELAYFRYFMYVVRGAAGAFYLLEGDVREKVNTYIEKHIKKHKIKDFRIDDISPPRFSYVAASGGLVYSAWILYSSSIFQAEIEVTPDGRLDMLNDHMKVSDVEGLEG